MPDLTPEHWRQIEDVYNAARQHDPASRRAFLERACRADSELLRRVELMLAKDAEEDQFLDRPPAERAIPADELSGPAIAAGQQLGPYLIESLIGAGGMGRVYKARDTRLGRTVAIKVSNRRFGDRVQREARAVAALNHPNICSLFDVGSAPEAPAYLVMELLEGATLLRRLREGRPDVEESLHIAGQIAGALEAAHARGIVHRDIKPGNVFLLANGHVKVLDFGLAKMTPRARGDETQTVEPDLSRPGETMGTVAYMAPEQARGEEIDARSDLWSLGVLLHEMLAGARPFAGGSNAVVYDAIFNHTPAPPSSLNPGLGPDVDCIVARLLEKDREKRYASAAEVVSDLKLARTAGGIPAAAATRKRGWRPWAAAGLAAAVVAGVVLAWRAPAKPVITSKDVIVVADFVNRTGDTVFDGTLREALSAKLQQSELILPMGPGQVRALLAESRRAPDTPVTPEVARELCIRAGEKAMLNGTISALGSSYALLLSVTSCQTGEVLATSQAEAASKEKVLAALGRATDRLAANLGEPLASVNRPGRLDTTPFTTASLEAAQAFAMGSEEGRLGRVQAAIPHFRRARTIDPEFASAWVHEGVSHWTLGRVDVGRPLSAKAYELREKAGLVERMVIEGDHHLRATGDLDKAREAYEEAVKAAPRSVLALNGLAEVYSLTGDASRAVRTRKRQIEIDPFNMVSYMLLINDYEKLDGLEEAREITEIPFVRKADAPGIHWKLQRIAYMLGDLASAEKEWAWAQANPDGISFTVRLNYLAAVGRFREAQTVVASIREIARRAKSKQQEDAAENNLRARRAWAGDCAFPRTERPAPSILALLACGENARTIQRVEESIAAPGANADSGAVNRAVIALARRQPREAIDALEPVRRLDANSVNTTLRGLAYMQLKQPAQAAAEFRKEIARRSQLLDSTYASAHVRLARALTAAGQPAEAKQVYGKFLDLWKNADPGIPLLEQARKELAALP